MRKSITFLLAVIFVLAFTVPGWAVELAVAVSPTTVELANDGTGSFQIEVDTDNKSYTAIHSLSFFHFLTLPTTMPITESAPGVR